MSDTGAIIVALITTVGTILIVLIDRTRRHALASRRQVENSHATNMREENDERHEQETGLHKQTLKALRFLTSQMVGVQADIRGVRRDVGRLADADVRHDQKLVEHDDRITKLLDRKEIDHGNTDSTN